MFSGDNDDVVSVNNNNDKDIKGDCSSSDKIITEGSIKLIVINNFWDILPYLNSKDHFNLLL